MDFKDLKKKIDGALKQIVNKDTFNEIGKTTSKSIQTRTRLGKGVDQSEGKFVQLKPLKESTKSIRKNKKAKGHLSNLTTPTKSNLTDTGEMLESLKWQSTDTEVRIYIDGPENEKKAKDQVAQGRKFMNLSKSEVAQIVSYINKKIKDSFNNG